MQYVFFENGTLHTVRVQYGLEQNPQKLVFCVKSNLTVCKLGYFYRTKSGSRMYYLLTQ